MIAKQCFMNLPRVSSVNYLIPVFVTSAFSALMLLVGRQEGIRPVKKAEWGGRCWRGYLSGVRCRLAYGPANATATHCLLLQ